MVPSPWGVLVDLLVGVAFIGAAGLTWRRVGRHPDRRVRLGIAIDLVVGLAALADAAAVSASGLLRVGLWGLASLALVVGVAVLFLRGAPTTGCVIGSRTSR